jgi:multisubunit Na+/H+ antiporter MnhE subunit
MLHAAAMLVGLFVLAFLLTAPELDPNSVAAAAILSLTATVFALRFAGATPAFAETVAAVGGTARGAGSILRGALATIRRAAAADVMLRPALMRMRASGAGVGAQARLGKKIGAAPGAIVVEIDEEGLLAHVLDEGDPSLEAHEDMQRRGARP